MHYIGSEKDRKTVLNANIAKDLARSCGFDLCGITAPEVIPDAVERFDRWLAEGNHAAMDWLVSSRDRRVNPRELLPNVRSVIMLGVNYYNPNTKHIPSGFGRVSRYARGRDYHKVLGRMIKHFINKAQQAQGARTEDDFFWWVDYGAFLEREYARAAGVGYIGKNTMLINRDYASWVFLAEVLTSVDLQADDSSVVDHGSCGECTLCIDACPTEAISEETGVDSRRCISYLTIERPREIPEEHARRMGSMVFGCDICQEVCPHTSRSQLTRHRDFLPEAGVGEFVDCHRVLTMTTREQFLDLTAGTPLTRPRLENLQRNARIVLDNQRRDEDS
ncbi:tRNA epoxyqueuosine(34) reductase QueG [candidate division GN15 bacterium]|nr:tRNA epoxyqueuosine(34) reductase QueG [candidate division GN15 bacterium]